MNVMHHILSIQKDWQDLKMRTVQEKKLAAEHTAPMEPTVLTAHTVQQVLLLKTAE